MELNKFYELCNQTLTAPQLTPAAAARRLGLMIQYIALSLESMEYEQKNRHPKQGHPLRSKQDNIRYAMDYMDNNYSSINLKDVAEYIGINYNYFSSIFKEDQGIPPNEYLLRVRMRHSSHMLANLTMDIQDISRAVGYEDSLTFSKVFKRFFPVTDQMHEDRFFVVEGGKRLGTPLFIALIVIETTDVAFAVDSIPAVFSVSRDPFIILTSNIFAILGLRALYFALAAVAKYFTYLKYGLGIILSFVGVKMLLELIDIEVPTPLSLAIIFGVLVLSMGLSVIISRRKAAKQHAE